MSWDICLCGHLLQSHQDAALELRPCRGPACGCPVFVSEDEPMQLALVEDEEAA